MQTLYIATSGLLDIEMNLSSGWNEYGKPLISASGQVIPTDVLVQHLLYPSGLSTLTRPDLQLIFDEAYDDDRTSGIWSSGVYYNEFSGNSTSEMKVDFEDIVKTSENSHFKHSYCIRYDDRIVYDAVTHISSGLFLTKASQPFSSNFISEGRTLINMSGVPVTSGNADLHIDIDHDSPLINPTLGDSKYYLKINKINDQGEDIDEWFDTTGGTLGSGSGNILYDPFIHMELPYSEYTNSDNEETNYRISLSYFDQDNVSTKDISFTTKDVTAAENGFTSGQTQYDGIGALTKGKSLEIPNTYKQRLALDIEDIALEYSEYNKTGVYYSPYYSVDVPLYTILLMVKEGFADNVSPDSIKYFIQLDKSDEIRISPANRDAEFDESNNIIPKLLVLDKLDISSITSSVGELSNLSSVYSFRVIIRFDVKTINGTEVDTYFIPPFVDSYECHITDKESFLRI